MDSDLARRSHAVLMKAIELDACEREAFVNSACAHDPALRARVADLIGAIDRSRTFLQIPALEQSRGNRRPALTAPEAIRNYRIVRTIGVGGMATVYEALQDQPRRRVALKVLRHGLAHTSAIERFRFETEVLARLQHPGIAQIFEAGAFDDGHGFSLPFFAMEFVPDASSITAYARQRGLSIPQRLNLLASVCDAVQHGHQHGVIHRDLKPGNVLVDQNGSPKVIDFGVARASDPDAASITRDSGTGQLVGTLHYMSPEQCLGGAAIDIRTDVYALGVILYELVCERLPHDLSRLPVPEALRVIRDCDPPRPAAIDPRLRGDIDAIVQKALCKEPRGRYATVAALADDIRRHLQFESVEARPPTITYRTARFVRRHRLLITAASVVLLAIVGGAVVSGVFAIQAWREAQARSLAEQRALADRDAARWRSYVASIAAAHASLQTHEYLQARTRLSLAPEEHRAWEWEYLSAQADTSDQTVAAHEGMIFAFSATRDASRFVTGCHDGSLRVWDVATGDLLADSEGTPGAGIFSAAFSPDGGRIVTGSADRTVRIWDAWTGEPLLVMRHADEVRSVSWGAGEQIVSASQDGVGRMWDAATGELLRSFDDQPGGVSGVLFSTDGSRLVTWGRSGTIWLRNAAGECQHGPFMLGVTPESVALSRTGDRIAAGGGEGRLYVWDVTSGQISRDLSDPNNASTVRTLQFSPSGDKLAAGHIVRSLVVYSLSDPVTSYTLHGHEEAVSGLAFSRDERQLFSASWDRTIRRWNLETYDRAETNAVLRGHEDHVLGLAFSPDGSILASASRDHTVRLWDPECGVELGALRGHPDHVTAVAFSPDGERLASAGVDRVVRIWNARTGACEDKLGGHSGGVRTVTFSCDGRLVAWGGEDKIVRVWDLKERRMAGTLRGHTAAVNGLAFSPDGDSLASASRDTTVRLWDLRSDRPARVLEGHALDVFAVVFSRDEQRLFSGARDQSVRVWNLETGACERELRGHGQFVTSLSLNPDGTRLAAGSWFGELVIWDVPRLEIVASLKASPRAVRAVAFSPDGRRIASGSYEHTIRIMDSWTAEERARARETHVRNQASAQRVVAELARNCSSPAALVEALETLGGLDSAVRAAARTIILKRALQASATEKSEFVQPVPD